jgi:DNA polymerase sigma
MGSNEVQHLGIQCCNYIKSKIDEHPNLKIMALLFKKFLSLKNLNKPYKGGLSSYSLIQMILAVLHIIERDNLFLNIKMSLSMIFKKFVWEYG